MIDTYCVNPSHSNSSTHTYIGILCEPFISSAMECHEDPDLDSTGSSYVWNSDYWYDTPIKYTCPEGQSFEDQDKRVMYGNCTFQSGDTEKIFWRFNSSRQLPNCVGKENSEHILVFSYLNCSVLPQRAVSSCSRPLLCGLLFRRPCARNHRHNHL